MDIKKSLWKLIRIASFVEQNEQDAWENAKWLAALLYYSVEEFGIGDETEKGKADIKDNKIKNTIENRKVFRAGKNGKKDFR